MNAETMRAMRFTADLQDNEDNMSENIAMAVTCDQYDIGLLDGFDLLDATPDDWESQLHNLLAGDAI